jgi:hypothetical protein
MVNPRQRWSHCGEGGYKKNELYALTLLHPFSVNFALVLPLVRAASRAPEALRFIYAVGILSKQQRRSSAMSDQSNDDFLTKRLLAQRYKKNPKTIERWTQSGVLPEPDMIVAKQPYWRRGTIERNERERMGVRSADATEHAAP